MPDSLPVIDPILIMMLIPPFMMQPGLRIPGSFPLGIIRAAVALIIAAAYQKFCRRIFRHVMQEPLTEKPHLKTLFHYQPFMMIDRP